MSAAEEGTVAHNERARPHTTTSHMCPHTPIYLASSYSFICVVILVSTSVLVQRYNTRTLPNTNPKHIYRYVCKHVCMYLSIFIDVGRGLHDSEASSEDEWVGGSSSSSALLRGGLRQASSI